MAEHKPQFDRADRALGRDGQGLASWQLTELLMAAQHGEFDLRVEMTALETEMAQLQAENSQLLRRAAAQNGGGGGHRSRNLLPCFCVRPTCRAASPLPVGGLPGNGGPGGAETPTGRSAGLATPPAHLDPGWGGRDGHWECEGRIGAARQRQHDQGLLVGLRRSLSVVRNHDPRDGAVCRYLWLSVLIFVGDPPRHGAAHQ